MFTSDEPEHLPLLVVNAGSSTLKVSLFTESASAPDLAATFETGSSRRPGELRLRFKAGETERHPGDWSAPDEQLCRLCDLSAARGLIGSASSIRRVGHRIVHGGTRFAAPTVIDADVQQEISRLSALAPLHNPRAAEAIVAAQQVFSCASHVAVFDTAYFASLPEHRLRYPLPYAWTEEYGIRRFGFHGISHAWCAAGAADVLGRNLLELNVITCHLGSGCSIAATEQGRGVATSMGFTPLDGVMMATRPGGLDPGILLHLLSEGRMSVHQLTAALNRQSGLAGISGMAPDMRAIEAAARGGHPRAELALEMFAESVRGMIGQLAVTLGRVDALVFTAGIGENSAAVRERICRRLDLLGLMLDPDRNRSLAGERGGEGEGDISTPESPSRILVIPSREDVAIARSCISAVSTHRGHS